MIFFKYIKAETRGYNFLLKITVIIEEDFGQKIRVANEEFYASIAGAKDAELLEISEGAPVLHLVRTTYSTKNEIIEYTLSVARADQFRYKISHVRN